MVACPDNRSRGEGWMGKVDFGRRVGIWGSKVLWVLMIPRC